MIRLVLQIPTEDGGDAVTVKPFSEAVNENNLNQRQELITAAYTRSAEYMTQQNMIVTIDPASVAVYGIGYCLWASLENLWAGRLSGKILVMDEESYQSAKETQEVPTSKIIKIERGVIDPKNPFRN